ncbi:response regulator, partial [Escherichia coli]|uniref:response regulator n=1 Tax=Escherichia coli TaxID=562 RepID=UPI000AE3F6CC
MSKIRVLSVDDSALMRQIMTEIINSHSDMEMVATAPDPLVARDLIKKFNPDVLTLDVEMPRMDGLDFLEKLMRLRPMPVVNRPGFPGECFICELRLPDHRFRWKHNKLFLLLP